MFHNHFLYTDDEGNYQSRQMRYAMPMFETAQHTVFKDVELPELVFDADGEMIIETYKHKDLE